MINLTYKKGDLFEDLENKKGIILLHSCNSLGVWGSGIAKTFKEKFFSAFFEYHNNSNKLGSGYILEDNGYKIGCLITSSGYGNYADPPPLIVKSTSKALKNLFKGIKEKDIIIHSPKINAGLFKVPWEETEEAILTVGNESDKNITWLVFEL